MPGSTPMRSPPSRPAPSAAAVAWAWTQMKRCWCSGHPNASRASMTDSAAGPDVMWLAIAAPVSWATLHAASRTRRSVSVMPLSFCESLMKPAGTPVSVDALGQLLAHEVGDLLDRRVERPVGHERLPVDARHEHRGQPRTVGDVLDDVGTPAHALGRELDEDADAERLGVLAPTAR